MAEQIEMLTRCLASLTQIAAQNAAINQLTIRQRVEKDLRYVSPFEGIVKKLPSFIEAVDRVRKDYVGQEEIVFRVIYDLKIGGSAKNFLQINPPENWESCKTKLRQHYRPTKNQLMITKEISILKVNSIAELSKRLNEIVDDITEYSALSENGDTMRKIFSGMLIQRIKQLASGAFAYTVQSVTSLTEMANEIYKFIGLDEGNLNPYLKKGGNNFQANTKNNGVNNKNFYSGQYRSQNQNLSEQQYRPQSGQRQINLHRQQSNQTRQPRWQNRTNYSEQVRTNQNHYNYSQQQRNSVNSRQQVQNRGPEPMDVDTMSRRGDPQESNTNEEFFTNQPRNH